MTSGAVIALAMTFNELCTNTTKFGALSIPTGRVEIAWTIDDDKQRLRLTWTERGGPAGQAANATQLRHTDDGISWSAIEWPGAARLRTDWICLLAGRAATLNHCYSVTLDLQRVALKQELL